MSASSATVQAVDRQLRRWELERRAAVEQEAGAAPAATPYVSVTISRKRGCRGAAIAACLAARLGYQVFDKELVDYIATHHNVRQRVLDMLDEKQSSAIRLWAEGIVAGRHIDRRDFVRFLSKTVRAIHEHGGVVVLGRGANCILDGRTAYRVQLTAPLDTRVAQVVTETGLDEEEARAEVLRVDAERESFIRNSFGADWDDAALYDLALNVAGLADETVAEMIEFCARRHGAEHSPQAAVGRAAES